MIRVLLTILFILVGCVSVGSGKPNMNHTTYFTNTVKLDTSKKVNYKNGRATWYGGSFHGKKTANGEIYDMYSMTCATRNRSVPFNTRIEVTCVETGKKVIVRVNDRMAKHATKNIDLSIKAFKKIAPLDKGVLTIKYRFLD